jgi:hypothetical protein
VGLLPQLRELVIKFNYCLPYERQWTAILAGVAAATSLTKLELDPRMTDDYVEWTGIAENELPEVAVCASLTALTRLKDLTFKCESNAGDVWCTNLAPGDALALTALTGLTSLDFGWAEHGVCATAATALANNLKQLQQLCLNGCMELETAEGVACLAAIGRLTKLTYLDLEDNPGLTGQGLMQLTGLSRLQELYMDYLGDWMSDWWLSVWPALRRRHYWSS